MHRYRSDSLFVIAESRVELAERSKDPNNSFRALSFSFPWQFVLESYNDARRANLSRLIVIREILGLLSAFFSALRDFLVVS